ncbi:MAG: hypothetical protein EBS39_02395 [Gammaproteobacteria bacterium]|nr:hypothetical protein [Gammaproteobacteria bacterium]
MDHPIWVYLHIMLFVYWLGADLGVFLLAKAARRPDLSFAERAFALRMAVTIDLVPRLCFAVMFPVGLHVTASGGFAIIPGWAFAASWAVSAAWILLLFAMGRHEGTPRGARLSQLNLALQALLCLLVGALGVSALAGHGPLPGGWYGAKVFLFACVFALGIGIDIAFRPVGPAFMRLAAEGSSPAVEAELSRGIDGAVRVVIALYLLLALIAFIGVAKPF